MKEKFKLLFLLLFVFMFSNLVPKSIYAATEVKLAPNKELRKRLSTEFRDQIYAVTIDKSGYQNFKFLYLESSANTIGKGFTIEIKDADKKILHSVEGIEKEYISPNFAFKKGETVYVYITEAFDFVDPVNGIDIRFQFNTIENKFFETEPNDSFETAIKLSNSKGMKGNLYAAGDMDFYSYKVPFSRANRMRFKVSSGDTTRLKDGYSVEVYDVDKKLIAKKDLMMGKVDIDGKDFKIGQTVYVKIFATNTDKAPDKVDYVVTAVSKIDKNGEAEVNDKLKKANKITKTKSGFLTDEFDVDCFVFQSKSTKKHKITLDTGDLENKSYQLTVFSKGKGSKFTKKLKKKITKEQSFSVSLKKGEKIWIELKGKKNSAPIAKEYKLTIQ